MNIKITNIARLCQEHLLTEKILLAPNQRAGKQWADQVARAGKPVVNLHIQTLSRLALTHADPELRKHKLAKLPATAGEVLAGRAWNAVGAERFQYFKDIEPTPGLLKLLFQTFQSLRLAGIEPQRLRRFDHFETPEKRADMAALFYAYEQEIKRAGYADTAQILEWATAALKSRPQQALLLVPNDLELSTAERALIDAWPETQRMEINTDEPNSKPKASVIAALGESGEVRAALRACIANGWALDEVELLYTDAATYAPLLLDFADRLKVEHESGFPITFADGLPARWSRPARALQGWLEWLESDCSQSVLVRLIEDGLLELEGQEKAGYSFSQIAAWLVELPIGIGRDRYAPVLRRAILRARNKQKKPDAVDDDGDSHEDNRDWKKEELGLACLLENLEKLIALTPAGICLPAEGLKGAEDFMRDYSRGIDERDNYAKKALIEQIKAMRSCFKPDESATGFSWTGWLRELPDTLHVMGSGARAGHLHCASLKSGGHSGRPHTLVLGLDDSRMPGAGRQDPFLLDRERKPLSSDLKLAGTQIQARKEHFARMVGGLRGELIYSTSTYRITESAPQHPSLLWLDARNRSGSKTHPQSIVPEREQQALDSGDWWLWKTARLTPDTLQLVEKNFEHLSHGMKLAANREEKVFTEFDGYVPEAGHGLFEKAWSAGRLETLGKCPLQFFYKSILGLEPPPKIEKTQDEWMEPMDRGNLMHRVFQKVVATLAKGTDSKGRSRDHVASDITRQVLEEWKAERPEPAESVWQLEKNWLYKAVNILLKSEKNLGVEPREVHLEVSIGLPQYSEQSALDDPHPMEIALDDFGILRVHGKIDRIEVISERGNEYRVIDYKSGSPKRYRDLETVQQARYSQPALYREMAERVLQRLNPKAVAASFEYHFPQEKGHGETIVYEKHELEQSKPSLIRLCTLAKQGAFPVTSTPDKDCRYCDFKTICGSVENQQVAHDRKLNNPDNQVLAPFRELRGKNEEKKSDGQAKKSGKARGA